MIILFLRFLFCPAVLFLLAVFSVSNMSCIGSVFDVNFSCIVNDDFNDLGRFECHNPKGIKLLSRIRLGLSHLREPKFKHSFQDTLNPICICGKDIETPCHYLLACPNYDVERSTLLNNLRQIAPNILNYNNSRITQVLLYGDTSFKNETNTNI